MATKQQAVEAATHDNAAYEDWQFFELSDALMLFQIGLRSLEINTNTKDECLNGIAKDIKDITDHFESRLAEMHDVIFPNHEQENEAVPAEAVAGGVH